jgi:hypothetical protein
MQSQRLEELPEVEALLIQVHTRQKLEAERLAAQAEGAGIKNDETKEVSKDTEEGLRQQESPEQVFKEIKSLEGLWKEVFRTYKRMEPRLENSGVTQKKKGRRRLVDVAQFVQWIDIIKKTTASSGINPNDRSTWTDEVWDSVAQEFANYKNMKDEMHEDKQRREATT